jgi:leucyl-tRNA synthetase
MTIVVQVNGRLRGTLVVSKEIAKDELVSCAQAHVGQWLVSSVQKVIVVPGKLINFVMSA